MAANSVMIIGEKENFVIRVLLKKLADSGIDAFFASADINVINGKWDQAALITYYMETNEQLSEKLRRFLTDKMVDNGKQMILIGDPGDTRNVTDNMPGELIYKIFPRPLDNDSYIKTVSTLFDKIASGEFKKSILIVDDDPTYMGLVRDWLKSTYKVSMAASGLQAIKWLAKNKVDLILLDYEMPVTSGPQVLEMLRSDEETKNIPVIFLTGKGDRSSVMEVVSLKPEGYLLKTIAKADLLSNLENFFIRRKQV